MRTWPLLLAIFPILFFIGGTSAALSNDDDHEERSDKAIETVTENEILDCFHNHGIESFIKSGLDVFSTGIWDELVKKDEIEAIKYLSKNHFKNEQQYPIKALHDSLVYGAVKIARYVLNKYEVNAKPCSIAEQTAFAKMACDKKLYKIIKRLVRYRFEFWNVLPNNNGRSLIHDAVLENDVKLVSLVEKNLNSISNLKDDYGNTPLHYVSDVKIFQSLLINGEDPFIKNDAGISGMDLAQNTFMKDGSLKIKIDTFKALLHPFDIYYSYRVEIRRERVLEDSYDQISKHEKWYQKAFVHNILFKDENSVHNWPSTNDWMTVILERFIESRKQNEEIEEESELLNFYGAPFESIDQVNKIYGISNDFTGPVDVYKFLGSIVAKSILKNVSLGFKLAPSILKILLGEKLTLEDLKSEEAELYNSYAVMSGDGINANCFNCEDYLYTRYKEQIDQFVEGFSSVICPDLIKTFFISSSELQLILSGSDEIDRLEFYRNFYIRGKYWKKNRKMIRKAFDLLTDSELLGLLRLITGLKVFPYGGVAALNEIFAVYDEKNGRGPLSFVRGCHLYIPIDINNVADLVGMFRTIIESRLKYTR